MRLFLRRAALILATGSLVFFLSCERHKVGELPEEHGHHKKAPAEEHASKPSETTAPAQHSHSASSPEATPVQHSHASPSAEPRNSPANFFPDKPKP